MASEGNLQRLVIFNIDMKIIASFLVLISFAGSISAQTKLVTIEGYLKTRVGNGEYPLENVLISLLHHNRIQETNKNGYFSFKNIPYGTYRFDIPEAFPRKVDTTIVVSDSSSRVINVNLTIGDFCEVQGDSALKDISEGRIKLLLQSGEAPVVYLADSAFQKKYNLIYHDYGCISEPRTCMLQYNRTVFEYLDQTFGRRWRREVRKDVIGLKR